MLNLQALRLVQLSTGSRGKGAPEGFQPVAEQTFHYVILSESDEAVNNPLTGLHCPHNQVVDVSLV